MSKIILKKYKAHPFNWILLISLVAAGILITVRTEYEVLGMVLFGFGSGIFGYILGSANEKSGAIFEANDLNIKAEGGGYVS